ncbi:hypothetical protein CpMRi49_05635 [Corynebacterium ulcerans]|uniref:YchJ-like middle NTF2-like domain-containing protein n=1 Tax=Corynebacterium ulcerans TaxID=65058 RepID=A0ABD7MRS1_CORUL|nr:YchJ family metal-binding protein [Corynebacterium ulcerans]AIT89048.1 Hypothetical protein Cul210932_1101 [Corynebacterium ulcerans]AIU91694.1 Hypothetical protein Cul05146_1125 [Corynebacterium ulcerans]ALD94828.1 Hypothetical protein Cul131001_1122 [Corynebacterium ulcerans]MBH5298438.1 hypothetical protein [Corynebacterium ulcerans]MBH5303089.1 hypothetical protein [Corynebacterium ulcerans]
MSHQTIACPCMTSLPLSECCQPFLNFSKAAPTAATLMRSRFTAFALENPQYLVATWHPSTRPADLELDPDITWTRLIIHDSIRGGLLDTEGIVEFTAFYECEGSRGKHHERSRFTRVDGLWTYVDGIVT